MPLDAVERILQRFHRRTKGVSLAIDVGGEQREEGRQVRVGVVRGRRDSIMVQVDGDGRGSQ